MTSGSNKKSEDIFSQQVGEKENLKLKAQQETKKNVWFGLGLFGMIGWSIAVPTLLGVAFGMWLDRKYPTTFSWTLTFLVLGLFVGCLIAWFWVLKEHKEMHPAKKYKDE